MFQNYLPGIKNLGWDISEIRCMSCDNFVISCANGHGQKKSTLLNKNSEYIFGKALKHFEEIYVWSDEKKS